MRLAIGRGINHSAAAILIEHRPQSQAAETQSGTGQKIPASQPGMIEIRHEIT
jgi:hypothetical protein